jgi:hypothetical protein
MEKRKIGYDAQFLRLADRTVFRLMSGMRGNELLAARVRGDDL